MKANALEANAIAAVSPALIEQLHSLGAEGLPAELLPNGAPPPGPPPHGSEAEACLVGLLNERLDLACLEAVVDAGVKLRVVGPRVERDKTFGRRLGKLLAHPGVAWTPTIVPPIQVRQFLAQARVGLTPYATNAFNQASFPLKTFDYLAAGLPVVSTDIFASRWLGSEHIRIAANPHLFARLVKEAVLNPPSEAEAMSRQQLALDHGWSQRAAQMLRLAGCSTD
jgi:teichuronic acid biosynthesis glycosyltransferase TuaH